MALFAVGRGGGITRGIGCTYSTRKREEFRKHWEEAHNEDERKTLKLSAFPNIVPRKPMERLPGLVPASEALFFEIYGDPTATLRSHPSSPQTSVSNSPRLSVTVTAHPSSSPPFLHSHKRCRPCLSLRRNMPHVGEHPWKERPTNTPSSIPSIHRHCTWMTSERTPWNSSKESAIALRPTTLRKTTQSNERMGHT